MKIKSKKALKEFLIWCKDNDIIHIEIDDIKVTFSEALVAHRRAIQMTDNNATLVEDQVAKTPTEDDLTYWSS